MKNIDSSQDNNLRPVSLKLLTEAKYIWIRFITLIAISLSFITIFYNSISFSCILSLIQNFFLVILATKELLRLTSFSSRLQRLKSGSILGLLIGAAAAFTNLTISNIRYYFLGYRELAYTVKNQAIPSITSQNVLIGLWSDLFIFCILVSMSLFAGLIVAMISRSNDDEDI